MVYYNIRSYCRQDCSYINFHLTESTIIWSIYMPLMKRVNYLSTRKLQILLRVIIFIQKIIVFFGVIFAL
jgi:hypothetical protein